MKRIKPTWVGLMLLFMVLSCNNEDLNVTNPNEVVIETYFNNADELERSVNAIFATIQSSQLYGREYWFLHDLRSDDNQSGGGQLETPRNQLLIGTHDPGNFVMNQNWNGWYQAIHRANTAIVQGPQIEDISAAQLNRLVAEARFARGWAYFELGSLWGGVPIYTSYATTFTETSPKSSQAEVFAVALEDLNYAIANLPEAPNVSQPGRPTKGAALAMAGRLHMFMGDYASAKGVFDQIVQSGHYSLTEEYDDNFQEETEYNSESILEIGYADIGGFNWNGTGDNLGNEEVVRTQEYSAIGWRNLIPSLSLLNDFERVSKGDAVDDPRFAKSFYAIGDTYNNGESVLQSDQVQGNTVNFEGEEQKISWRKYSVMYKLDPGGFFTAGINMRVIRYAEVLLNLAECELETGSPDRAIAYLNQVRERPSVDMPPYPTANYPVDSETEIVRAIIHEKRVELNSEQIRNRDMLRWRAEGKFQTEPLDYFVNGKHELLPIPQAEIDNNALISESDQNPGY